MAWRRVLMLLGLLLALGQVPSYAPQEAWAEEAIRWLHQESDAWAKGIPNVLLFVESDIVFDDCCSTGVGAEGIVQVGSWLRSEFGPAVVTLGDVYVDVEGTLAEYGMDAPGDDHDDMAYQEIGPSGITVRSHGLSVDDVRRQWPVAAGSADAALDLVGAYLQAWSAPDRAAVAPVYADGARMVDSLRRVELAGRAAVEGYAEGLGANGLPTTLTVGTIEDGGGPAVYLHWPDGWLDVLAGEGEILLAYTVDDGTGCPEDVAVSLRVGGGLIEEERRFHAVESVRRCWAADHLPTGWWTGLEPPPALQDEVTGAVEVGGQRIEIHNGTAPLEDLVVWAMKRYEAVGLPAPPVASIAFDEDAHPAQCADRNGLTVDLGDRSQVFVCLDQVEACPDEACTSFTSRARLLVLHELAHAWMNLQVDPATEEAFLAHMGLDEWDNPDLDWYQQGVEQAAQVIAWGLMDEAFSPVRLGDRPCDQLVEGFRVLTGLAPLQTWCPSP